MESNHNKGKSKIAAIVSSEAEIEIIQSCLKYLSKIFPGCIFLLTGNLDREALSVIKKSGDCLQEDIHYFDYNSKTANPFRLFTRAFSLGNKKVKNVILIIDPFSNRLYTKDKLLAAFSSLGAVGVYETNKKSVVFYPRLFFLLQAIKDIFQLYVKILSHFINPIIGIFGLLFSPIKLAKLIIRTVYSIPEYTVFLITFFCLIILKVKLKLTKKKSSA